MISIRTEGSVWLIDEDNHVYLRMPRTEMEREPGWWDEPEAGDMLKDLEWHPYARWWISDAPVSLISVDGLLTVHEGIPLLVIVDPADRKLLAPRAELLP